jgi:hypothetical protein
MEPPTFLPPIADALLLQFLRSSLYAASQWQNDLYTDS